MKGSDEDKKKHMHCCKPIDPVFEDRKLHNDGVFDSLMGYKEWFHFQGAISIDGNPLSFMLGFARSLPAMGALGWITYKGKQYSLDGNPEKPGHPGFYELKTHADFEPLPNGYIIEYPKDSTSADYKGSVKGTLPHYTIDVKTPDISVDISMTIKSPEKSVISRNLCPLAVGGWFHSGDISLNGTISGRSLTSDSGTFRGWYERNWANVPDFWPSQWRWLMTHLENGGVLDLLIITTLGVRIHYLDECWLYWQEKFCRFSDYQVQFSEKMKKALKEERYSDVIGECITCEGRGGEDSFRMEVHVTDFRQYHLHSWYGNIKWANFVVETDGEAVVDRNALDMKGRGSAENALMKYWWI